MKNRDLIKNGAKFELDTNFEDIISDEINVDDENLNIYEPANEKVVSPWTKSFNDLRDTMTKVNDFIWKKIIKTGSSEIPKENARVKIHLNAFFESDKEPFDSSYLRGKPIVIFKKKKKKM